MKLRINSKNGNPSMIRNTVQGPVELPSSLGIDAANAAMNPVNRFTTIIKRRKNNSL